MGIEAGVHQGPKVPDLGYIFGKIIAFLLYERGQETELKKQYRQLVMANHELKCFEPFAVTRTFDECSSAECKYAKDVLAGDENKSEVTLTSLSIDMLNAYEVDIQGNQALLHVKLRKKPAILQAPPTPPPQKLIS